MTTEGQTGRSAARHRSPSAENAAGPGDSPEAAMAVPPAAAGRDVTADAAATEPAPPDDPEELREQIERTRDRLGETVQALAAKADVKARAQDKAAQLTERLKGKADQARQQAIAKAGQVQGQLADKTAGPRQKVASVSGPANEQVRQQAATAVAKISTVTPDPVQRAAAKAADTVRRHRVPLAVAVGAAVLAWLVIGRWRRR
jgi:Protein of unknown function (DUF3618)